MKRDKKIIHLAKKLVELSKGDNGVVTDAKVAEVLAGLKQVQHRSHLKVLKSYLNYLRREVALQTAVVSTPASNCPEGHDVRRRVSTVPTSGTVPTFVFEASSTVTFPPAFPPGTVYQPSTCFEM